MPKAFVEHVLFHCTQPRHSDSTQLSTKESQVYTDSSNALIAISNCMLDYS